MCWCEERDGICLPSAARWRASSSSCSIFWTMRAGWRHLLLEYMPRLFPLVTRASLGLRSSLILWSEVFLAGVRRLRPVARATAPQWVLPLVLNTLYGAPFEPLGGASLKWLSVKTALLLALATGKRVSDLQALSIQAGCLVISGDASKAVLRPNPSFVPKVVQSPFAARPVELAAFFPPPHASGEEERLPALCPVCALAEYIRRTAGVRSTSQFLVCYGPGKVGSPLSKQRLSHWLCEGIVHAYEAAGRPTPGSVRAHSTRGMAASAALFGGVPVADICAATPWATPPPFIHYFLLDMAPVSSASSVLGSASANVQ